MTDLPDEERERIEKRLQEVIDGERVPPTPAELRDMIHDARGEPWKKSVDDPPLM